MIKLAIDGSRQRSGGGASHLIGLISSAEPEKHGFGEVHVWSYDRLLASLPDRPWLVRHCPPALEKSMAHQLAWQRWRLPEEIGQAGCQILLNTDAGSVGTFSPAVTMCRNMLPFDPPERDRYKWTKVWLRLLALGRIHRRSLKRSEGVIFLTRHAADVVTDSIGAIPNYAVIPHGVPEQFRDAGSSSLRRQEGETVPVRCLYVSNVDEYKHQWNVVRAIALLRKEGLPLQLDLVGGGDGPALSRLQAEILHSDPRREFVIETDFVPHSLLKEKFAQADIFIFASSCENMPNTLLEGMAAGLPIACSNRGPMPEVLRDGGAYFDPEDPVSISDAVRKLVLDAELRKRLAERSRRYADEFSWKRCADETLAFLMQTYKSWRAS